MASLQSHLLVLLLKIIGRKRPWRSVDALSASLVGTRLNGPATPSARMARAIKVDLSAVAGHSVYELRPHGQANPSTHLFYFHGGGYIRPITGFHWRFLCQLVKMSGCRITVPLYPLAPEHQAPKALDFVRQVYKARSATSGAQKIFVAGDSAGGGLAVALTLSLRDERAQMPDRMILITPWLDVALDHPSVKTKDADDPFLSAPGAREAGRWYAGKWSINHPIVSPLLADLHGLPPATILAATRDIVHSDATRFAEKLRAAGGTADLWEGAGALHVWPLLPIPEGRMARKKIAVLLR
ncbi:MAG: alpha/beta hydrolase [Rubrivivax sp.]|nr:MAG: alpha/beta hydrolase [Rubrivivax sp.]